MGRHGAGGSVFAYIEEPSEVMIELSHGMIRCGEDQRWDGPRVWPIDEPRGADLWGSPIPQRWIAKHVDLPSPARLAG